MRKGSAALEELIVFAVVGIFLLGQTYTFLSLLTPLAQPQRIANLQSLS